MTNPTLISLFAGAGGLDVGLERAGFQTVLATDCDGDCCATLVSSQQRRIPVSTDRRRRHLAGAHVVRAPIAEVTESTLRSHGLKIDGPPDLLAGGPPCQPFSSSGLQRSVLDDRGRLFEHFVRIAAELEPKFILFENVRGLVTARGPSGQPGEALNMVREAFEGIGYATSFALLNAADFGAPQRRVRLFMLAAREHQLPPFPSATHGRRPETSLFGELAPWVSLADFMKNRREPPADEVVRPSSALQGLLAGVPDGSGLKSPGKAEPTRPGGHWGYKQGTFIANPELPARTVTAASTQDWIRASDGSLRRLAFSECAALQGFPKDWAFSGKKTSRFRQVGNAVPAVLGEVLGKAILPMLEAGPVDQPPVSEPYPERLRAAVAYTTRDHERNASSRARASAFSR